MGQRKQIVLAPCCQETVEKPLDLRFLSSNMRIAVLSFGVHVTTKEVAFSQYLVTKKCYANVSWPFVYIVALVS